MNAVFQKVRILHKISKKYSILEAISLWFCWTLMEVWPLMAFRFSGTFFWSGVTLFGQYLNWSYAGFRSSRFTLYFHSKSSVVTWSLNQLLLSLAFWAAAKFSRRKHRCSRITCFIAAYNVDFRKLSGPSQTKILAPKIILLWKCHSGLSMHLCCSFLFWDLHLLIKWKSFTFISNEDLGPPSHVLFHLSPCKQDATELISGQDLNMRNVASLDHV